MRLLQENAGGGSLRSTGTFSLAALKHGQTAGSATQPPATQLSASASASVSASASPCGSLLFTVMHAQVEVLEDDAMDDSNWGV